MSLQVIGAGLPRTGTTSLSQALEILLDGQAYHMSKIPGHPFDLGADWDQALAGNMPDWHKLFEAYNSAVDWPASMFYRELSEAYPNAIVILSTRDSADTWIQSLSATVLPVARMGLAEDWNSGRALQNLLEHFTGTTNWDDPDLLRTCYEQHNKTVRETIDPHRLLDWRASDGWTPLCTALRLPVPDMPFPWTNKRENWG